MATNTDFDICRLCLMSGNINLTSLFDGLGEKADIFQILSKIDVR